MFPLAAYSVVAFDVGCEARPTDAIDITSVGAEFEAGSKPLRALKGCVFSHHFVFVHFSVFVSFSFLYIFLCCRKMQQSFETSEMVYSVIPLSDSEHAWFGLRLP